ATRPPRRERDRRRAADRRSGCGASGSPCLYVAKPRIESIVKALADRVDGQDGERKASAGHGAQPPRGARDRAPRGNHKPPAHAVRVPDPKKPDPGPDQTAL